ncbi:MAG TPA: GntR family transcriptional regulator [bacterium]|jgi:DNA-binding GntR family transcriptional regulator|nr:GntR family transcriptional regulator [bacterium]
MGVTDLWGVPPEREPASATAYRMMRQAIIRGQIPQGARVNELELAGAWRMSRTPIRDALRRLEAEGLLEAVPRKGMIVRHAGGSELEDLYDLCEVLEGLAARRAAQRGTPAFIADLNGLIKAYGAALKADDAERMLAVDDQLHGAIAEVGQHQRLGRAIENLRAQLRDVRLRGLRSKGRATKSFREMAKMTAAIRGRDAPRAEAAMREHIASLRAELAGG